MSTISERIEYGSSVRQSIESSYQSRACVDVIPIRVQRYTGYSNYNPEIYAYDRDEPVLVRKGTLKLRFSRERESGNARTTMERLARYKRVIDRSPQEANKLRLKLRRYVYNHVSVSEDEHPYIIEQILCVLQQAVPDKIIDVHTLNLTIREPVERNMECLQDQPYFRAKLIPATESFIQALAVASPPDDDGLECVICMEMFAHTRSITKLSCSHYYHRDCIVPWLHINHLCPTCRHPNAPST